MSILLVRTKPCNHGSSGGGFTACCLPFWAKEAIAVHIQGLIEDGEPVPEEDEAPLQITTVTVDAPAA